MSMQQFHTYVHMCNKVHMYGWAFEIFLKCDIAESLGHFKKLLKTLLYITSRHIIDIDARASGFFSLK